MPVGGDAERDRRCRRRRRCASDRPTGDDELGVVVGADADEDAGAAAAPGRSTGCPASSSASQATSSSSRCCGSICTASRGEMPKNAASKSVDVRRGNRPRRGTSSPARPGRGRRTRRGPSDPPAPRRSRRRPPPADASSPPDRPPRGDGSHPDDRDSVLRLNAPRTFRGANRRESGSRHFIISSMNFALRRESQVQFLGRNNQLQPLMFPASPHPTSGARPKPSWWMIAGKFSRNCHQVMA